MIATVPAGELEAVSISPSGGAVVVEGPVEPRRGTFNASSVTGAADLLVSNVKADHVYLASSGASRVFLLNRDFPDARVKVCHLAAGGTSSGFVFGADNVDLFLEGAADVAVDPRPGGNITGVALGANSVFAVAKNTSSCNVGGPVFGQACVPVRGALASRLSPPVWTCGLAAVGPFSCPVPGGGAAGRGRRRAHGRGRAGPLAPAPGRGDWGRSRSRRPLAVAAARRGRDGRQAPPLAAAAAAAAGSSFLRRFLPRAETPDPRPRLERLSGVHAPL